MVEGMNGLSLGTRTLLVLLHAFIQVFEVFIYVDIVDFVHLRTDLSAG